MADDSDLASLERSGSGETETNPCGDIFRSLDGHDADDESSIPSISKAWVRGQISRATLSRVTRTFSSIQLVVTALPVYSSIMLTTGQKNQWVPSGNPSLATDATQRDNPTKVSAQIQTCADAQKTSGSGGKATSEKPESSLCDNPGWSAQQAF